MTAPGTIYWGSHLLPFGEDAQPAVDAGVFVAHGTSEIADIGPIDALRAVHTGALEVGGRGALVMPGLIDAHQHGRAATAHELGIRDEELELWLLEQRAAAPPDVGLSARIAAAWSLLGGVTTLLHAHVSGDPRRASADAAAAVGGFAASGARVLFGMDVRDRASFTYADDKSFLAGLPPELADRTRQLLPPVGPANIAELDDLLATLAGQASGSLVHVALAPRGPQWCTPETLEWLTARAQAGVAIQTHAAETRAQYGYFAESGSSPVQFLDRHGLLGRATTLAHCVWLDPTDVELLATSGTTVAHNPSSNLRLGSGRAPLGALRTAGVPVGIGTDSVALVGRPDLFAEIRLAHWLEQAPAGQFRTELFASFAAALAGGGRAARPAGAVGELGIGHPADIVVLAMSTRAFASEDVPPPNDARSDVELALQRASRDDVTDVVVGGREVVRDRRYLPFDLAAAEQQLLHQLRGSRPDPARRELVKLLRPDVDRERRRLAALTESVEFVR